MELKFGKLGRTDMKYCQHELSGLYVYVNNGCEMNFFLTCISAKISRSLFLRRFLLLVPTQVIVVKTPFIDRGSSYSRLVRSKKHIFEITVNESYDSSGLLSGTPYYMYLMYHCTLCKWKIAPITVILSNLRKKYWQPPCSYFFFLPYNKDTGNEKASRPRATAACSTLSIGDGAIAHRDLFSLLQRKN